MFMRRELKRILIGANMPNKVITQILEDSSKLFKISETCIEVDKMHITPEQGIIHIQEILRG